MQSQKISVLLTKNFVAHTPTYNTSSSPYITHICVINVSCPDDIFIEIEGKCVADLMQWLTGGRKIPVLGLGKKIKCLFLHMCQAGCRCRPVVSTCDLRVTLPVHLDNEEEMVEIMTSALKDSTGFDLI